MTLVDVMNLFDTDEKCREVLCRLRWPNAPECPRCHGPVAELATAKQLFYCKDCDYQFTVTAGTIFNDSHLSLSKWFIATLLMCESRKGHSANQMKRELGVSYKTAWYLCHRIRRAMLQADRPMLDGTVEIDETYIGGYHKGHRGKFDNKQVVFGIRQRNGELRFIHASDARAKTARVIIGANLSEDVEVIITDESSIYPSALNKEQNKHHHSVNHSAEEYVRGDIHTNTVESAFSLLKRGIVGTWHRISAKHLQAYLDEMCFRFDRRKSHTLFLDTLRHMVTADPLTFESLTA
jgi:transposase-like protein